LRSIDVNAGCSSSGEARLGEHELAAQLVDDVELVDRTGHSCTHARQLVHAQSSSSVM
jgi:hypothetical protein